MKTNFAKRSLLASLCITSLASFAQWAPTWGGPWSQYGNSNPGIPSASPWVMGGNMIIPAQPPFQGPYTSCSIGTLDGPYPFVLKANNHETIVLDPNNANVSVGEGNWPHPVAALDVRGNMATPSNFRIYGNVDGSIESTTSMKLHYSSLFEIHEGVVGGTAPTRFSINNGFTTVHGDMNVGAGIWNTNSRLGIDGLTKTGLTVISGNGNIGLQVCNNAGAGRFYVMDDGRARIGGNTEIGFVTNVGFADPNARLNVDGYGAAGIKVSRNNNGAGTRMIYVQNTDVPAGLPHFEVLGDGTTYIGQGRPKNNGIAASAKLSVDGMILAKDIRVAISTQTHWADYVFEKDYKLMPLSDVEKFVNQNKHLPGVPSEAEVKKEGMDVTEMNIHLLQKLEELYLHSIEMKKQLDAQAKEIEQLKKK